jgi:CheY-like chemotaxis protein
MDVARDHGFKTLAAYRGSAALSLARERRPQLITLDMSLPDIDGWRVLDRLKQDLETRHVPVQVITTDEDRVRALRLGAKGVLSKPIKTRDALDATFRRLLQFMMKRERTLLLVGPDDEERHALTELLGDGVVTVHAAPSGAQALAAIRSGGIDIAVLSLDLADMRAFDLIDHIAEDEARAEMPLIVYAPGEMATTDQDQLDRLAQALVLKHVRSPERLFDEVSLHLHRQVSALPKERRELLIELHQSNRALVGKKVLIVDDDIRNIFAMTTILDAQAMSTVYAETGRGAIELLEQIPDIDVVLMDIMMPEMDGYDTIRAIRAKTKFHSLPIVAVTAKAMKGDRDRCFEAGANDYISKPVDPELLLSTLRLWLYR